MLKSLDKNLNKLYKLSGYIAATFLILVAVFILIGICSYWDAFSRNISFMLYVTLQGQFLKKSQPVKPSMSFFFIACYPILIPDSEST